VPLKYACLADGDVLGFDHSSRKFRTGAIRRPEAMVMSGRDKLQNSDA
jgi:hypothetical protein